MKKFIAASAALAIVLTGAPQAAAFSSMSSSSPAISKPSPKPTTPKPTTTKPTTPAPTTPAPAPASEEEVYAAIYSGHNTALKNRGYVWSEPAMKLMQIYAHTPSTTQPYHKAEYEARGYTVTVVEHSTADFKAEYDALMATPVEPYKYKQYGVYVVYGEEITTAYILTT